MNAFSISITTPPQQSPLHWDGVNFFIPWGGPYYSDTGLSTGASAANDAVRAIPDRSRNRYDLLALGNTERAIVSRPVGYRPHLSFNGSHYYYGGANSGAVQYIDLLRGGSASDALASFSLSIWANFSSLAAAGFIASRYRVSQTGGWRLGYLTTGNAYRFQIRLDNGETTPSTGEVILPDTPATGTWNRFTVTYLHTVPSISIRLNLGTPVSLTTSTTIGRANAPVRVGAIGNTTDGTVANLFNGSIGEIVAKTSAFTDAESAILQARGATW